VKNLARYLDDLLVVSGCVLVLGGVYQISPVATWLVAGGMLILFGVLLGLGGERNDHS
jgi:uncharacterized membrane protein SirB2